MRHKPGHGGYKRQSGRVSAPVSELTIFGKALAIRCARAAGDMFGCHRVELVEVRVDVRRQDGFVGQVIMTDGTFREFRLMPLDNGDVAEWCLAPGCRCFGFDTQATPIWACRLTD